MADSAEGAAKLPLFLQLESSDVNEWVALMQAKGSSVPVGPISTLVPEMFHNKISNNTLKAYLTQNMQSCKELERKIFPASIPVIVKAYTDKVYEKVMTNLNELGQIAVETIHPWILNVLVDWDKFDEVICKEVPDNASNREVLVDHRQPECQTYVITSGQQMSSIICTTPQDPVLCQSTSSLSSKESLSPTQQPSASRSSTPQRNDLYDDEQESEAESVTATGSFRWSTADVLRLIDAHSRHEDEFKKPSTKKKNIWTQIATELSSVHGLEVTGKQCEQKWKNITKNYRDTVDHNSKSGNDRKECPYFKELEECYGYRPNVRPVYTFSSADGNGTKAVPGEQCSESETTPSKQKQKKSKQNKTDVVLEVLGNIRDDINKEHNRLLDMLNKQHEDRMQNEKSKLDLLAKLVSSVNKSD